MAHSPMRDDDHGPETCTLHINVTGNDMDQAVDLAQSFATLLVTLQGDRKPDALNPRHYWITESTDWAEHFVVPGRESEYTNISRDVEDPAPPHYTQPDKPFDQDV